MLVDVTNTKIPDLVRAQCKIYRVLKPGDVVSMTEEFLAPDYPRRSTALENT